MKNTIQFAPVRLHSYYLPLVNIKTGFPIVFAGSYMELENGVIQTRNGEKYVAWKDFPSANEETKEKITILQMAFDADLDDETTASLLLRGLPVTN